MYRDTKLEADLFDIGTTWEDYVDFKFVQLSKAQAKFHEDNPEASPYEVWNMELTPPHVRTLEEAKAEMIQRINEYDASDNVNGFTVNHEIEGWFTADERSNYRSSIESSELLGIETLSFYVGDYLMEVTTKDAKYMLAQIQLYADQCYIVTKQHKLEVEALDTIEAVDAFDFISGYPQKLNFEYETVDAEETPTEPAGE
jgi:predicted DNA binding CopG/RHH family protein